VLEQVSAGAEERGAQPRGLTRELGEGGARQALCPGEREAKHPAPRWVERRRARSGVLAERRRGASLFDVPAGEAVVGEREPAAVVELDRDGIDR
jgi:hypothetical protein